MVYDEALAARMRALLATQGDVDERRMFGGLTFMVGGQMCCGVLKNDLFVRIAEDDAEAALREPHVRVMDFVRRPMPGMLYVAQAAVDSNEQLGAWLDRAVEYVRSHPRRASASRRRR